MPAWLPKHPIPMKTVFRNCFLANFAIEPETMQRLLPPPLEPDVYEGKAFLSIVIADMERMRPAFLPAVCGVNYTQVVYRAVIRCQGERGVHFLRSDADNRWMCLLGNGLTFFHFHFSRTRWQQEGGCIQFDLTSPFRHHADIHATYEVYPTLRQMPSTSRFRSLAEAQEFLVELYAAYASDASGISRVRIKRGVWNIEIVQDIERDYAFMNGSRMFPKGTASLDSVFYVRNLPYRWYTLEKLSVTD
jgi:uncharacterized protein YqjF (DUF2071 family)